MKTKKLLRLFFCLAVISFFSCNRYTPVQSLGIQTSKFRTVYSYTMSAGGFSTSCRGPRSVRDMKHAARINLKKKNEPAEKPAAEQTKELSLVVSEAFLEPASDKTGIIQMYSGTYVYVSMPVFEQGGSPLTDEQIKDLQNTKVEIRYIGSGKFKVDYYFLYAKTKEAGLADLNASKNAANKSVPFIIDGGEAGGISDLISLSFTAPDTITVCRDYLSSFKIGKDGEPETLLENPESLKIKIILKKQK